MAIRQDLETEMVLVETLLSQIAVDYKNPINLEPATTALVRAKSALADSDEQVMRHAWVEVAIANASAAAQMYSWCEQHMDRRKSVLADSLVTQKGYFNWVVGALRRIEAARERLDEIPEVKGAFDVVADSLRKMERGETLELLTASNWIFGVQNKLMDRELRALGGSQL